MTAKLGDPVIFYTHEGMDGTHTSLDVLAFVLAVIDDNTVELVTFPVGGPVVFCRSKLFDPASPGIVVGQTYWRPAGTDAPDFSAVFTPVAQTELDPAEVQRLALANKQEAEIAKVDRAGYDALKVTQAKEWADLEDKLARDAAAIPPAPLPVTPAPYVPTPFVPTPGVVVPPNPAPSVYPNPSPNQVLNPNSTSNPAPMSVTSDPFGRKV